MYYSWLLASDVSMYDETHDITAAAVNTSIAETLGQVCGGGASAGRGGRVARCVYGVCVCVVAGWRGGV